MKNWKNVPLQQIHLGVGSNGFEAVEDYNGDKNAYTQEHQTYLASLVRRCPATVWPKGSHNLACPRPVLVSNQHQQQLTELHEALNIAITDIVQRWWTDCEARFPERMPLEEEEEDLLQWIETQVQNGAIEPFAKCQGSWRPDFIIGDYCTGSEVDVREENFRISEINARFMFNGLLHAAYGQQAFDDMRLNALGLESTTDGDKIINGLHTLFQQDRPLHLAKGQEYGFDIHMFIEHFQNVFGIAPKVISPSDLILKPDPLNKGQNKLYCIVNRDSTDSSSVSSDSGIGHGVETELEEIHQLGVELDQTELLSLGRDMLREISVRCVNDMRTILLVHDKRMLGIVKQELGSLTKRKVLNTAQASALDKGIIDTLLPGSTELRELLEQSRSTSGSRNEYLLKPIRGGKGAGIIFGDELSPEKWVEWLERLQSTAIQPGISCVVQRRVVPLLYDVVLKMNGDKARYPLIGTYHAVHGEMIGLGTWRSSGGRICALSHGGSWICSVTYKDDWRSFLVRETSRLLKTWGLKLWTN